LISGIVKALNSIGYSLPSFENISGALAKKEPEPITTEAQVI